MAERNVAACRDVGVLASKRSSRQRRPRSAWSAAVYRRCSEAIGKARKSGASAVAIDAMADEGAPQSKRWRECRKRTVIPTNIPTVGGVGRLKSGYAALSRGIPLGAKPAKNRFTPVYAGLNFRTAETGSAKRIHHRATEGREKEVSPENAPQKVENATSYSPRECYAKNSAPTLPPLPHTSPALWRVIGGISVRTSRVIAGICGQLFRLIRPIPPKNPSLTAKLRIL